MTDSSFDLDAYLARIGHAGPRAPTLDTLRGVHRAHAESIAFENLDALTGRTPGLHPDALLAKLVHGGRGGWCFEQNGMLRHALAALGFRTTPLAGRVVWNVPVEIVRPRSHMVLLVHLDDDPDDGPWLADVGFGVLTLTAPLRLVLDEPQQTPHETFRFVADEPADAAGAGYMLQVWIDEAWRPVYRFGLQPQLPIDYEVTNWYLANHPQSHFRAGLIAALPAPGRRYTLRDAVFTQRETGAPPAIRTLGSTDELRDVLTRVFRLTLPEGPEVDAALDAVIARSAATK